MYTWEIRIEGIVQGVGFRPRVFQLAHEQEIKGEIANGVEGVRIWFNAESDQAQAFYESILQHKPPLSHIVSSSLQASEARSFVDFQIIESETSGQKRLLVTPDYGICPDCRREINDESDRRFAYPFITCTQCGPRYSIIENLPYDRPWTTMAPFQMCPACLSEYQDPLNRRHFSQTNSCPACGIQLRLFGPDQQTVSVSSEAEIRQLVQHYWKKGQTVAIKGIGGFLLTCDATQEAAVQRMRERKHRPEKPFALMFPGLDSLHAYYLDADQIAALEGPVSPIVLIRKPPDSTLAPGIAKGLTEIGVMLPYTPLYQWLLQGYGQPIVATSGNIHQAPIVFRDEEAASLLDIADWVLTNDRRIVVPQDDSVLRFTTRQRQRIVIRRSRGLAPNYFATQVKMPKINLWAAGADMKSSFGLLHEGNVYLSQYLGDLSHYDTERSYQQVQQHLQSVLGHRPAVILHDQHPHYASTRLAQDMAREQQVPVHACQHHKAHFAAVLAENDLIEAADPVLGVIWDGTGLGEDGQIWGGELMVYANRAISREGHLAYFPVLGGDKMAQEPRLSALAILPEEPLCQQKFSLLEQQIYSQLRQKKPIQSSSMGRLFDAVASVLGVQDQQTYEGQAAMKLEALARAYWDQADVLPPPFPIVYHEKNLPTEALLQSLIAARPANNSAAYLSARFHASLIEWVRQSADRLQIKRIAFSGGVMQNAVLVDGLLERLGSEYELFFHQQLSPNDENISFGQMVLYLLAQQMI
jgi:hydrogenase maturation protein HypF